ncbi:MAG: DNA internalization-related competence protein ComEC/Rec2 [Magnetococcus sp. YQC-5]
MSSNVSQHVNRNADQDLYPAGVSSPALFLAWMIVGVMASLPSAALESHRVVLVPIAAIPAVAAWWTRFREGESRWLVPLGLLWGVIMVWSHQTVIPNLPPEMVRQKVIIQGVVTDREDRKDSQLLILDEVVSGTWHASGRVRVTFSRQRTTVMPGDRVRIPVRLRPLSGYRNPGGFDYRTFLLEQGVMATGSATGPVEKIGSTQAWFWNRWRQEISDWIAVTLPVSQRGLGEALLVGKRGHLESDLLDALFVSGTFHLVAISGLHLTLVGGTVFFLVRLGLTLIPPLSRRWDMKRAAALVSLGPVLCYCYLAGWSVSVQRAFIMVGLFLLSVVWQRRRQSWRILALSAIAVLSWQPSQLMNIGFQLSYLCVMVILFLVDHLPAKTWKERVIWAVVSTVSIGLVLAPVELYSFNRFSPYGMIVNFFAIPWVGEFSTPLGLAGMVIHEFWPKGGDLLLGWMGWTLEIYRELIEWTLRQPGSWSRAAGPTLPGVALFLAAGVVAASIHRPGVWWWKRVVMTVVALLGLWWPREFVPDSLLRLIVLDVGQAMSMLLKMPGGGWSVVDAGGAVTPRFNIGEAVTSASLWHFGVKRLERVVVSHPQQDHMSGVVQLMRNFPVGSLWLTRMSISEREDHSAMDLLAAAERFRVPVRFFDGPQEIREGAGVLRILPPLQSKRAVKLNDRSLVVEIVYGQHRFLLTGDMEKREEAWLVSQKALQPVTVLLAPHHGSLTSSSHAFVQAVHPEHVVFSVGQDNQWGFPKPEVVRRWREIGARLWRTDQDGAVSFHSDGMSLKITTGE